jgi:acetolactate synthase-1/2/3 large subunit
MTTYADVVATTLKLAGIEYIFGVPGSLSSVELIEAAGKQGIRYILCSNESSAAAMAGVYGVMKNRPGAVSTGVGPGAAAAVHGTVHLMLERAPALILTDRFTDAEYLRLPRQRVDQPAMFRSITKGSFSLSAIDTAKTLQRAIDLSMAGRQGPVHVDLPYDLMQAEATDRDMPQPMTTKRFFDAPGVGTTLAGVPDGPLAKPTAGIDAVAAAIEGATRPAVVAGFQIAREGAGTEAAFLQFAEKLNVPVFNSLARSLSRTRGLPAPSAASLQSAPSSTMPTSSSWSASTPSRFLPPRGRTQRPSSPWTPCRSPKAPTGR